MPSPIPFEQVNRNINNLVVLHQEQDLLAEKNNGLRAQLAEDKKLLQQYKNQENACIDELAQLAIKKQQNDQERVQLVERKAQHEEKKAQHAKEVAENKKELDRIAALREKALAKKAANAKKAINP